MCFWQFPPLVDRWHLLRPGCLLIKCSCRSAYLSTQKLMALVVAFQEHILGGHARHKCCQKGHALSSYCDPLSLHDPSGNEAVAGALLLPLGRAASIRSPRSRMFEAGCTEVFTLYVTLLSFKQCKLIEMGTLKRETKRFQYCMNFIRQLLMATTEGSTRGWFIF